MTFSLVAVAAAPMPPAPVSPEREDPLRGGEKARPETGAFACAHPTANVCLPSSRGKSAALREFYNPARNALDFGSLRACIARRP